MVQDTLSPSIESLRENIKIREKSLQELVQFSAAHLSQIYSIFTSTQDVQHTTSQSTEILSIHLELSSPHTELFKDTLDIDEREMEEFVSKTKNNVNVFDCTIEQALDMDNNSNSHIPYIFTFLMDSLYRLDGHRTHQIFRVPPDKENVQLCKLLLSLQEYERVSTIFDSPHLPAELIKHWLRSLLTPLIPTNLYRKCLASAPIESIYKELPLSNQKILQSLFRFIIKASTENHELTNMSLESFATILTPSIIRGPKGTVQNYLHNLSAEHKFVLELFNYLKNVPET